MSRTGMRARTPAEDRAIKTVVRMLDEGAIGREDLRITEDANFKAMWEHLNTWAWTHLPVDHPVRKEIQYIVETQPGAQPIRAVNVQRPSALE